MKKTELNKKVYSYKQAYSVIFKKAEILDNVKSYIIQKRDEAVLPTTKAIYQAIIDLIEN